MARNPPTKDPKKQSPLWKAVKLYAVAKSLAKLEESAIAKPIRTDMTSVAQITGGSRMRPKGRTNIVHSDSAV